MENPVTFNQKLRCLSLFVAEFSANVCAAWSFFAICTSFIFQRFMPISCFRRSILAQQKVRCFLENISPQETIIFLRNFPICCPALLSPHHLVVRTTRRRKNSYISR